MAPLLRYLSLAATAFAATSSAVTIAEINGDRFVSPLSGQNVTDVSGIVTAKGPDGLWIRSTASNRTAATSESIYVFGRNFGASLTVGDEIVLAGRVTEFRSNRDFLFLTEITNPVLTSRVSTGNPAKPRIIGQDTTAPPTEQFSGLDGGDVFAVPNNVSLVSVQNPKLQPEKFGLDFWESLTGELVTVRKPKAISKPNNFGDTWVYGDWKVTGRNGRGGLTMTDKDANPETIIIGSPLDGTRNPNNTRLGDDLDDITGIVTYAFGFYRILPRTAVKINRSAQPPLPPVTSLVSSGKCDGVTFGAYNVENLWQGSAHLPDVASHIVEYLQSPDVILVQEVQDDNGPTNDAVVSANATLSALIKSISAAGGSQYAFIDVSPVDDTNGGQPGGNIRTSYLYKPSIVRLFKPNSGSSTDKNEVLAGPSLKFNPGLIDPANAAWRASRKPLVAQWEVIGSDGNGQGTFFTVNVHFGSKGGSSSIQGDARPPSNGGVDDRQAQAELTANFVKSILTKDQTAHIITGGDFNEFTFVKPLKDYVAISGLKDLDVVAGLTNVERYTYLFDMNAQALDHLFVSESLARTAKYEHIHINTWVERSGEVSDHDPSVAKLNVCK